MKRSTLVVVVVMMVLGLASICLGNDYTHPDLAKASNMSKAEKLANTLDKAQKHVLKSFPGYTPQGNWTVDAEGYYRLFATWKNGRPEGYMSILVSYDGKAYVQVNYGEMIAFK